MSSKRDDCVTLHHSDCLDVLITLEDNSIDAVITDPPYETGFRGHDWDSEHPKHEVWGQCRRLLKPGAYLLIFGGVRTWHRRRVTLRTPG